MKGTMAKHATAGVMLVPWLQERLWAYQVVEDASVSRDHCVFEWGLTVNQNQKKDYIRKQLWKDTSSIYEKSICFLQLAVKLQCWTAHEGLYLQKKNCIYQALSLSLSLSLSSTGRESKRRGQGELDPDQVQPPDCHFRPMHSIPSWHMDCHF